MDDGLGDLRPDAADDAFRPHEPRRGHRLEQMLRYERVDGRHTGDVEDGDGRSGLHDALQQRLHDDLRARAVEGPDHRQGQDAVPQLDDRGGELEQLLLLAGDDLFPRSQGGLDGVEAEAVEEQGGLPGCIRQLGRLVRQSGAQPFEDRPLEGEDEQGRLARREPLPGSRAGDRSELIADRLSAGRGRVDRSRGERGRQTAQDVAHLLPHLLHRGQIVPPPAAPGELLEPLVEHVALLRAQDGDERVGRGHRLLLLTGLAVAA
jgi:hypothetical protein